METLTLKSLHFRAFHGFYKKEREQGNDFEVDLIFHANLRAAGESDQLSDTVNYQEVIEIVRSVMDGPSLKLIESLTKKIGDQLFERFPSVQTLKVAVRKLHPPLDVETAYAEIQMQWQR